MSETIKIFVSYPGGLEKEVKHLRRCVDQMNKRRSNTPPIAIITWDKNIPAKSTGVLPQGYLSQHIDSCSGYICLIHNTVGKANNGDSGTLAEYAHALNLSKKRNDGFFISVFFKNFAIKTDASDEEVTAYEQVRDFQKKARSHGLTKNFSSATELVDEFTLVLRSFLTAGNEGTNANGIEQKFIRINEKYQKEYLDYPHAELTNSYAKKVALSDIFIPLSIERKEDKKNAMGEPSALEHDSVSVIDTSQKSYKIMFLGEEKSGKTTLAKRHFIELFNAGCVPILLSGNEFRNPSVQNKMQRTIAKKISEQYSVESMDETTLPENIVLLIDDFHENRLNTSAKVKLLSSLSKNFDRVICYCDQESETSLFTADTPKGDWPNFDKYIIGPANHSFRQKIVRKWHSLGRENEIEEDELTRITNMAMEQIQDIYGQNFIPKTPFYILVLLQALTVGDSQALADNTAVRCYKYLIDTRFLRNVNDAIVSEICYEVFPLIAHSIYTNKDTGVNRKHLEEIFRGYFEDFAINERGRSAFLKHFEGSDVLVDDGYGLRFIDKYIYYYFLAEYFEKNKNNVEVKSQISEIFEHLYLHENSNIIIFLSYLTNNLDIVDRVLMIANELLETTNPFSLETSQVASLNSLFSEIPKLTIDTERTEEQQNELNQAKDDAEKRDALEDVDDEQSVVYKSYSELDVGAKLNTSFKICQILGQLLKNKHVSSNADFQIKLTQDIYDIAMKSLALLLDTLSLPAILTEMEGLDLAEDDTAELEHEMRKFIFNHTSYLVSAFAHCTARFVGDQKLSEVFRRLLANKPNTTTEFLNTIVMLDYYKEIDRPMLKRTVSSLSDNNLGKDILRRLTRLRLLIRPIDNRPLRQSTIDLVGLDENRLELTHQKKKLKHKK